MLEYTIDYNINGSSYTVLNENTTDVVYNFAAKTLDASIAIESTTANVDDILDKLVAGDPIFITITYTGPSAVVGCKVAGVSSANNKVTGGVRLLSLGFEITKFTVT